jgi:hypothetical protein
MNFESMFPSKLTYTLDNVQYRIRYWYNAFASQPELNFYSTNED